MSTNLLAAQLAPGSLSSMDSPVLMTDVAAASRGDKDAFERLVAAHQSLVCSIALAISRDLEASEEIAQDTFVAAWKGLRKLHSPESFRPWLRQTARNRAHEHLRARIRDRKLGNASLDQAADSATDPMPNARERLLETEQRAAVLAAMDELPDDTREVLTLYYREGQSVKQVADLLDLTSDAVKKRLSRGRERLREDVELRLNKVLRDTVPSVAFTGAVMAAIAFAAPATAAATGLGIAAKASGPAATAGVLGGMLGGLIPALFAIWFGLRTSLRKAMDEQERRGLRIIAWCQGASVFAFIGLIIPARQSPFFAFAITTAYALAMNATAYAAIRVTRRRRQLDYLQNPVLAVKDRRRTILAICISAFVYVALMAGMVAVFRSRGRM